MRRSHTTVHDSTAYVKKLKRADEKKFNLRKAIYEIERLSYEKGTRPGDYFIREKIQAINEELDLFDSKIKTCDFNSRDSSIYKELLLFFEDRYLDNFILQEKIRLLKQTLIDHEKTDAEHNIIHKDEKYKRANKNTFRDELEKDLKIFENSLVNTIIQYIKDFLKNINDLLFYDSVDKDIEKRSKINSPVERELFDQNLKNSINFFIRINCKIEKIFSEKEAIYSINSLLDEMEIKSRLSFSPNIDQQKYNEIIINSAQEYFKYIARPESDNPESIKKNDLYDKSAADDKLSKVKRAIENLRYITAFKIQQINTVPDENPGRNREKKYIYNSPGSGKILLKDISEYLKDSLLFINEWLLAEIKKNQDSYDHLKLLADCLPAEINFYKLYEAANYDAVQPNNQKTNFWGDLTQFITNETAGNIIQSIESICRELKDAFIKTTLDIEFNKSPDNVKLAKKINIIYDSFEDARKKIVKEIRLLGK